MIGPLSIRRNDIVVTRCSLVHYSRETDLYFQYYGKAASWIPSCPDSGGPTGSNPGSAINTILPPFNNLCK